RRSPPGCRWWRRTCPACASSRRTPPYSSLPATPGRSPPRCAARWSRRPTPPRPAAAPPRTPGTASGRACSILFLGHCAPATRCVRCVPTMSGGPEVSVVVPFRDDEERVGALARRLAGHLRALGLSFELLFVDEDARDNSVALLLLLRDRELPELRVLTASGALGFALGSPL